MNRQSDEFRFIPDFTTYGNQPKVHAVATEVRSTLWLIRVKKQNRMRRRSEVNGLSRVSGRISAIENDAWYCDTPVRKAGREWCSRAPKSTAAHWLASHNYQQFPF